MDRIQPDSGVDGEGMRLEGSAPQAGILQTLISIARSIRALLSLRLAEVGLGYGQDEVLLALEENTPINTAILAARLELRMELVSRLLEPLIAKGFVERVGDLRDPRRIMVQASGSGIEMQDRVRAIWNEVGNDLIGAQGGEQLDRLIGELEGLQKEMTRRLTRFS
jgi:DNA-binding MarR family transcriptional regulator